MALLKWSILTLTMPSRVEFLARLMCALGPQVDRHPEVEWIVMVSDPEKLQGDNREDLRLKSKAEYISTVDDDDLVADDYVDRILPLLDGVDYVGFRLQAYEDGVAIPLPTYHSLKYKTWYSDPEGHYRGINHLNPIRRELAMQVPFWGCFGEDSRWCDEMRKLGIVKTEHYIDDVMYHYYYRNGKTDGVSLGKNTAGVCPSCASESTVIVDRKMHCNACGVTSPWEKMKR